MRARKPSITREAYDALLLCLRAIDPAPHDYTDDLGSHNPDCCRRCVAWAAAKRASGRLLALHDARELMRMGAPTARTSTVEGGTKLPLKPSRRKSGG